MPDPTVGQYWEPLSTISFGTGGLRWHVCNTCRTRNADPDAPSFVILTTPNAKQQHAFELLQQIQL